MTSFFGVVASHTLNSRNFFRSVVLNSIWSLSRSSKMSGELTLESIRVELAEPNLVKCIAFESFMILGFLTSGKVLLNSEDPEPELSFFMDFLI